MANITLAKRIDASLDAVWDSWADAGNVRQWQSLVSRSRLFGNPDVLTRFGREHRCELADGRNPLRGKGVDVKPQRQIRVDVLDGRVPLSSALVTIQVEAIRDRRTRVRVSMSFVPKFGLLGRLMTPLIRRRYTGLFRDLLDANARWLEQQAGTLPAARGGRTTILTDRVFTSSAAAPILDRTVLNRSGNGTQRGASTRPAVGRPTARIRRGAGTRQRHGGVLAQGLRSDVDGGPLRLHGAAQGQPLPGLR